MALASAASTQVSLLVIDDSAPIRRRIVGELQEMPELAAIREAHDKASALTALRGAGADVVILDIQLPDGSGLDVLRVLRSECVATGVIIFSNHPPQPLADGVVVSIPDVVFNKSGDFEDVKAAIRLLAGRRQSPGIPGAASLPT